MRRRSVTLIVLLFLLLLIAGVVAEVMYLRRQREEPSASYPEVSRFLGEAKFLHQFPADRGWSLANTKEESFTRGGGNKELQRTKYAFQDGSGKLVIVLLTRDGGRVVGFQVVGAEADEDAFRHVLLDKFPPLGRYPRGNP